MELLLLSLLGLGALSFAFGGDDDDEPDQTEEPDLGATVTETEDGLSIDLGADETGSLVAVKFEDISDGSTGSDSSQTQDFSLGIYLVPEGAEIPADATGAAFDGMTVEEYFDSIGATLVTEIDLGTLENTYFDDDEDSETLVDDSRVEPPGITTDDPLEIIRMQLRDGMIARSETDETLSPFEDAGTFYGPAELQQVTGDFTGTDGVDFVRAGPGGGPVTLSGLGGGDNLSAFGGLSTLLGGGGDDVLFSEGGLIRGGAGDDRVGIGGPGEAFGNDGDDALSAQGDVGIVLLHGGNGDDTVVGDGAGVTLLGDAGDDILAVNRGARGFGGTGNDLIQVDTGSIGGGGDGDDTLRVTGFFDDADPLTELRGGDGSDTFEIYPRNVLGGETAQIARITDFNPEEDVLEVGGFQTGGVRVAGIRIEVAPDESYTDVLVDYRGGPFPGQVTTAVIRLDGAVVITADQVRIAA